MSFIVLCFHFLLHYSSFLLQILHTCSIHSLSVCLFALLLKLSFVCNCNSRIKEKGHGIKVVDRRGENVSHFKTRFSSCDGAFIYPAVKCTVMLASSALPNENANETG